MILAYQEYGLYFRSGHRGWGALPSRYYGRAVRPVYSSSSSVQYYKKRLLYKAVPCHKMSRHRFFHAIKFFYEGKRCRFTEKM